MDLAFYMFNMYGTPTDSMEQVVPLYVTMAVILLVLHWIGRNAVWGGGTYGVIVGLIVALVTGNWSLLSLIFVIGVFAGTFFEWGWRLTLPKRNLPK